MELRVLQYFLAIAREQSIIRAAESLHLSQPTLSTQIKNMEEELGKQLLIRGTKGSRKITLTEEGMILRKRAEEILELVKKTEKEITTVDDILMGDIYIGTGETDAIRFIAKVAKKLQESHPYIHYHILSGNSEFVIDRLDKGLIDFGLVFTNVDFTRFDVLKMPTKDVWGVLMRKDSDLAKKEVITPKDLWDKPLILSQQEDKGGNITQWLKRTTSDLNIVATYNLIFNASLMVDEGLGYAITFDRLINTTGNSNLCFRPLEPRLENDMNIVWKKYHVLSKPTEKFITILQEQLNSDNL